MVEAAFAVLDEVRAQEPARLVDLAMSTGIPRPTVHRLLNQLVSVGAVRREGTKYRLGHGLFGFASGGRLERRLRAVATRPLAELATRTGAAAALSAAVDGAPIYLHHIDAREPLRVTVEMGSPVPAGTAQAKAHAFPLAESCVDVGRLMREMSCVAVPIALPGPATAVVTTLLHGVTPSPSLLTATRATATRIAGLLQAANDGLTSQG